MASRGFDPLAYKAGQRRDWNRAAEGWRKWWVPIEAMLAQTGNRLIESVTISPGQRVLDVATGVGEPALTVAKVVGPHGRVIGTDISPDMLQIARDRAADAGRLGQVVGVAVAGGLWQWGLDRHGELPTGQTAAFRLAFAVLAVFGVLAVVASWLRGPAEPAPGITATAAAGRAGVQ